MFGTLLSNCITNIVPGLPDARVHPSRITSFLIQTPLLLGECLLRFFRDTCGSFRNILRGIVHHLLRIISSYCAVFPGRNALHYRPVMLAPTLVQRFYIFISCCLHM